MGGGKGKKFQLVLSPEYLRVQQKPSRITLASLATLPQGHRLSRWTAVSRTTHRPLPSALLRPGPSDEPDGLTHQEKRQKCRRWTAPSGVQTTPWWQALPARWEVRKKKILNLFLFPWLCFQTNEQRNLDHDMPQTVSVRSQAFQQFPHDKIDVLNQPAAFVIAARGTVLGESIRQIPYHFPP